MMRGLGCWGALRLYMYSLGVFHHDDTAGAKKGIVTVGNNLLLALAMSPAAFCIGIACNYQRILCR